MLERVRSIRTSERRIWQKITGIYAECSIDYDKTPPTTRGFYSMVQNKFHYAISGRTAPEVIFETARFIDNSFKDGSVKTTGTDLDGILPPMSRFGGGDRDAQKSRIVDRLKAFFDKYSRLVP